MRILLVAPSLTGVLLATTLVACGGGNGSPSPTPAETTTAPSPTSVSTPAPIKTEDVTVTPTPSSTATTAPSADAVPEPGPDFPVYDASTRTGIAAADQVISAVTSGNLDATSRLLQYLRLPCVGNEKSGAAGVVRCQASEADGTIVSVFPVVFADRTYLRADDATAALRQLVKPGARVFAVYRVPAAEQANPDWPGGTLGIVFVVDGRGMLARVNDGGLVLLNVGASANRNPLDLTNLYRDFVIPPKK